MHLLKNDYDSKKDYKSHLKQKYMLDRLIAKRISKIIDLNQKINHNHLTHYFKSKESRPKRFSTFNRPLGFLRKIRDGDTTLQKAKKFTDNSNQI